MAKLTAHGHEVVRITFTSSPEAEHDSGDGMTTRYTRAYMSDGFILQKADTTYVSPFTGRTQHCGGNWSRMCDKTGKPHTFHKLLEQGETEARRAIIRAYCVPSEKRTLENCWNIATSAEVAA
jgi:hypothetical protein